MKHPISLLALKTEISYNPGTGIFVWLRRRRGGCPAGKRAGCIDPQGWRKIMILGKRYSAAKWAWYYMTKRWPASEVDHKNRKRDDDRWKNLRLATRVQQMQNSVRTDSLSGIRGVRFKKAVNKWEARISVNKVPYYLGIFNSKEEARLAYLTAAKQHHGEFMP